MTITFATIDELGNHAGEHFGYSQWMEVDQERIRQFGEATGDLQWIHVDPERARRDSPYGTTIAHGYLTLSLIPHLAPQIYRVDGVRMSVNYGCNKVRFPSPVPSGARVRLGAQLLDIEPVGGDGHQVRMGFTIEVEGSSKPACVAEVLFRYYV